MVNIDERIDQWKKKLLDLGKRNRLINFHETKRSNITITFPTFDELYKRVVTDEESLKFPFPLKTIYDENGEEQNVIIQEGDIITNKTLNEQQKTLKALRGRAKTSIEEQGVNSLYLTFGIIKWKESEISDVIFLSPLVLVPISLRIESITDPYILQLHEDEIVFNPSLAFKFENDFGIIMPEFDGHEDDITDYLSRIQKIANKNDWEVSFDVHLTLLSFLKINMYKDLNENKDKIVSNPIIKALSGDKSEISGIPIELNDFNHDKNSRALDVYQVVDADSSQQDAILLSKNGISFVLQGPPGTGKSQTITNIIAEAISDGKKVLFVSEKMAALDVVKKRLAEAGLEDFCLTLHSYKANKKEILGQLAKTLNVQRISLREDALYKLSALEEKRNKLNEYNEQLHSKCMPLNISMYEANGYLAKLSNTQDIIFDINNIENTDIDLLNKYKYLLNEFAKTIGKLRQDYSKNPWYGCNVTVVTHELRHDIEVKFGRIYKGLKALIESHESIFKELGTDIVATINNINSLSELLEFSSKSPFFPIKWMSEDINSLMTYAKEYSALFCEYNGKINCLLAEYETNVFNLNAKNIISTIENNMIEVKSYLNTTNFLSNKDIVLKADFILTECIELQSFIRPLYEGSKDASLKLGVEQSNNIKGIYEFDKLLDLILKEPQPLHNWFHIGKIQSLVSSLNLAENEQQILNDNLEKVNVNFREEVLSIDFNTLILNMEKDYNNTLKIISDLNHFPSYLDIDFKSLLSFTDNEAVKLQEIHSLISDAITVSQNLEDGFGIKTVGTINGFIVSVKSKSTYQ